MKKLLLAILIALPLSLQAKSYSIDSVLVQAWITDDGALEIEHTRVIRFKKGSFSWADYSLPLRDIGAVSDVTVREGSREYLQNDSEEDDTYQVEISEDELYIKWHYSARRESRRFTLAFTLRDVAKRHQDAGELFFAFAGEGRPKDTGFMRVTVFLPQEAPSRSTVQAWLRQPLFGAIETRDDRVIAETTDLNRRTPFLMRLLFPEYMLAGVAQSPNAVRDAISREELQLAMEREQRRETYFREREEKQKLAQQLTPWGWLILAAGVVALVLIYTRLGRGFDVQVDRSQQGMLPDMHPALFAGHANQNQVSGRSVAATLLELARRGIIRIDAGEQSRKPKKFILRLQRDNWKGTQSTLHDFENQMITFLFDELAGGDELHSDVLKKRKSDVRKWYEKWYRSVKEILKKQPFYDRASITGTVLMAVVGLAIAALGIVFAVMAGKALAFVIIGGFVLFALSFTILRMTPESKEMFERSQQLKAFIKKINPTNPVIYDSYDRYLVWAVALGLGEKNMRNIIEAIPQTEREKYLGWLPATKQGEIADMDYAVFMGAIIASTSSTVAVSSAGSAAGAGTAGAAGGGGGGAG